KAIEYRVNHQSYCRGSSSRTRPPSAGVDPRSSETVMNSKTRAIPTLKISISGVRGVLGDSLTPILLARFAQAFGTYVGSGTVVIGRDSRTSGEMVKQAVTAGLLSSGCRVLDIGMCPVPTIQLFARLQKAQGGIAITASHNPAEWNALKFIGPAGFFLD